MAAQLCSALAPASTAQPRLPGQAVGRVKTLSDLVENIKSVIVGDPLALSAELAGV